jgi:hypothetical protein
MPTVTGETRQEFIDKELSKKKSAFKPSEKPLEEMTHSQLAKHYEKASEHSSGLTDKLIEEGYGDYRPSDMRKMEEPRPNVIQNALNHGEYMASLHQEMKNRANASSAGYKHFSRFAR